MLRKGLLLTLVTILTVGLLVAGCGKGSRTGQATGGGGEVELKFVSYFALNSEKEWLAAKYFIDKVNKELSGKVRIKVLGGPEVVQAADQPEALRAGNIDMNFIPFSYYTSLVPEADALKLSEYSPMEMRKNGAFEFIDKKAQEKANTKVLGLMLPGTEWFYVYTTKKVDKADLSGLILRTIPIYEPAIKALGAKTVSMPISEVHDALQRKVIDGLCYPVLGADDLKLNEVVKYAIDAGFLSGEAVIVINNGKWQSLPEDVRKKIADIAAEAEEYGWNKLKELKQTSMNNLKAGGVEFVKLSPEEEVKFRKVIREASWAEIKKRCPDSYEKLYELLVRK